MRTFVIGDIHGCYDELRALLGMVSLTSDDQIIHIGDLVDRGPNPAAVVDFFRQTPNATSILGNRDDKHVRAYDGELDYNGTRTVTKQQFGDDARYAEAVAYMRTLPLYIELPEALLVHGYYEPGIPIEQQKRDVLLGHPEGETLLLQNDYDPWYEYYDGGKPIVFGHRDYPFLHYHRRAYAIDTRCVYGGTLTGLLLPDFTFYAVPARDDHWQTVSTRYAYLL